jgi:ATP-sulfurylase
MTAAWLPDPSPGHEGTSPAEQRAPNREGSRWPDGGRTAVHSPRPHGGRLTERLVPANRAEALAAQAARLYGTYAAQEAFDAYDPGELGIQPLRYEHAFFCRRCEAMATSRTCPHPPSTRVHLSGTAVRELLGRGELPPAQFSRPEVARLLADGYRAGRG